jgi:ribosome-binding protein aMBF1 (putative translation factor)
MAHLHLDPKFIDLAPGRRLVILEEGEFDRLLDEIDSKEARRVLADPNDKEVDWAEATKQLIVNRIAAVRQNSGVSQRELARRLRVKPSTVSRWERADANLTLDTLRKVAKALSCEVVALIS